MTAHIRAQVALVGLTLVICCVAYPLILRGAGKLMPGRAEGSLIRNKDGEVVGSELIARKFTGRGYFWPRPSHAGSNGYDASASGASNWGANNIKLRDRAARLIAPVARYAAGPKKGELVGRDVDAWFRQKPDRTAAWADRYPTLRDAWLQDNAAAVKAWQEEHPSEGEFFAAFAAANPGKWPAVEDGRITPGDGGDEMRKTFFDPWLQDPVGGRGAELEKVPADYVTASGSGLDPHIT